MLDDSYRVAARGSGTASVTPKGTPAFPDRDFSVWAKRPSLAKLAQGTVCKILAEQEVKPHKVRYYLEQ